MARKDALLRLHRQLVAQRDELRRKLSLTPNSFQESQGGDSGDMAHEDAEREFDSQLVSLETRELARIDRAIEAIQNGTYGLCEVCGERIPVDRLNALPHTSSCVACQRKVENGTGFTQEEVNWDSAWEFQSLENDRELTMKDFRLETE